MTGAKPVINDFGICPVGLKSSAPITQEPQTRESRVQNRYIIEFILPPNGQDISSISKPTVGYIPTVGVIPTVGASLKLPKEGTK